MVRSPYTVIDKARDANDPAENVVTRSKVKSRLISNENKIDLEI